jgi:protein-S-isoprenylcysteine O-methyltransferase Ste14
MLLGSGLTLLALTTWAVVHSLLASSRVKGAVRQRIGSIADRTYRLAYNVVGVLTLLPVLAVPALFPGPVLYRIPQPWVTLAFFVQFLALLFLLAGLVQTGVFGFLGIDQLIDRNPGADSEFQIGGLYAWVRHPLYTAGLVFIWLTPIMTTSTLVLFLGLSLYIYIGSIFEERRLIAEFGQAYRDYQRMVPRLVPRPWRRWNDDSTSTD